MAGIGISFVFPTLANAAVGSVPAADSGVAAGSNNTLRETGGLFGVAVLAAVFAAHGGYGSPSAFMHGIRFALLTAAAAALVAAARTSKCSRSLNLAVLTGRGASAACACQGTRGFPPARPGAGWSRP